jgi:hypothetical protein
MKKLFLIFGLLIFTFGSVEAQHSDGNKNKQIITDLQDSLQVLSYKMINDSIEPERYNANYKLIKTLVNALKTPNSFNYSFDSLKTISIQTSPDRLFRIFSWHVMNNDGSYRYYGTIQMNNPDGKLQMFPLVDYTPLIKNVTDTITTNDKWYGAQYYRIISVLNNVKTPYYVLLGWKGNTVNSTKKVIEILYFKDGKAYFGMPVFDGDKEQPLKKRTVFEYDRRASMVLNFEPSNNTVVFDHLAPPDPKLKGKFELYGPDLSYDGYKLVNGRWKFVQDLELKNSPSDQDDNFNDPKKMKGN